MGKVKTYNLLLKKGSYKLSYKVAAYYKDPAKKFPQLKDSTLLKGVFNLAFSLSWNFNSSAL